MDYQIGFLYSVGDHFDIFLTVQEQLDFIVEK